MSMELSSERVCYINCNYCNTILAVSVPYGSMFTIVTVRCGHCSNLLSVNMATLLHSATHHLQDNNHFQALGGGMEIREMGSSTSSRTRFHIDTLEQPKMPPIRPPEKRQRVPSAYNRFIKEEIQRIKASNPEISHREAFSTAAKNWAHFPHIHFGLKVDGNKQAKLDHPVAAGEAMAQKSLGF